MLSLSRKQAVSRVGPRMQDEIHKKALATCCNLATCCQSKIASETLDATETNANETNKTKQQNRLFYYTFVLFFYVS